MKSEKSSITVEKCKDAGLALVLLFLLLSLGRGRSNPWVLLAVAFLVATMTWPKVFHPFARVWFGLSAALGSIASRVLLSVLFFGLVLPVGLVRRGLGKDPMRLKVWKKGEQSVFRERNYRFLPKDLEHPY